MPIHIIRIWAYNCKEKNQQKLHLSKENKRTQTYC